MRKRVKVSIAVTVVVLTASGAAVALAAPWSGTASYSAQVAATSTTSAAPVAALAPDSVTPPTTVPKATPDPQLQAAQQKLNDIGYWVGSIDGFYGQTTQQALYAFQKINGLPASGKGDAATLAALQTASRPFPAGATGDVIEVDKTRQVIFFVKSGQTQWVFNTSTGLEANYTTNGIKGFAHTPDGTFKVLRVVDGVDPGPLGALYRPRYFTNTGIAIHGAASIPPVRASHGCARVSDAAMDYIWNNNMMPMGALVWVYDDPAKQTFSPPTTTTTTTTAPATTAAPTTTSTTSAPPTTAASVPPTTMKLVPPTVPLPH